MISLINSVAYDSKKLIDKGGKYTKNYFFQKRKPFAKECPNFFNFLD